MENCSVSLRRDGDVFALGGESPRAASMPGRKLVWLEHRHRHHDYLDRGPGPAAERAAGAPAPVRAAELGRAVAELAADLGIRAAEQRPGRVPAAAAAERRAECLPAATAAAERAASERAAATAGTNR